MANIESSGGERDEKFGFDAACSGALRALRADGGGGGRRRRDVPGNLRRAVDELRRGLGVDRRRLRPPPRGAELSGSMAHDRRGVLPDGRLPPGQSPPSLGLVTGPALEGEDREPGSSWPGRDPRAAVPAGEGPEAGESVRLLATCGAQDPLRVSIPIGFFQALQRYP